MKTTAVSLRLRTNPVLARFMLYSFIDRWSETVDNFVSFLKYSVDILGHQHKLAALLK